MLFGRSDPRDAGRDCRWPRATPGVGPVPVPDAAVTDLDRTAASPASPADERRCGTRDPAFAERNEPPAGVRERTDARETDGVDRSIEP